MKKLSLIFAIVMLLFQTVMILFSDEKYVNSKRAGDAESPITISDSIYKIDETGLQLELRGTGDCSIKTLEDSMTFPFRTNQIWFLDYFIQKDRLYLGYNYGIDYLGGRLVSISLSRLCIEWIKPIFGFSTFAVKNNFIYVFGYYALYKINMNDGNTIWMKNLFNDEKVERGYNYRIIEDTFELDYESKKKFYTITIDLKAGEKLRTSNCIMGICNDNRVRIRDGANLDAKILGYLYENDEVFIIERNDKEEKIESRWSYWYKLRTINGQEGWVFGGYINLGKRKN